MLALQDAPCEPEQPARGGVSTEAVIREGVPYGPGEPEHLHLVRVRQVLSDEYRVNVYHAGGDGGHGAPSFSPAMRLGADRTPPRGLGSASPGE